MIVNLAIRLPAKLEKSSASEALLAILADEMLWVPLLTDSIHAFTLNGLITARASGSKNGVEATLAVRTGVAFEKGAALKRLEALCADEMVHVPLLTKRCDASIQDRLVTVRAAGTIELLIASLAVGKAVLFVEVGSSKRVLAVSAHEMLRMEGLAQSLDYLAKNRLSAGSTGSARGWSCSVDVAHLTGQVGEQIVQIVAAEGSFGWWDGPGRSRDVRVE